MTTIYRPIDELSRSHRIIRSSDPEGWKTAASRPIRPIESVALEETQKRSIVSDLSRYLTPECERFYSARGYPYRRGYLLYGPPGTGETSTAIALVGHFGLDVFIICMSDKNMNDRKLENLFSTLPRCCIVLLEDVDSAGLKREASQDEQGDEDESFDIVHYRRVRRKTDLRITLSGLLNCIDGPASKEGRILLMTSNAPNSLDAALVRPGRCDQKILFGYASMEICIKLFTHLYTKQPDDLIAGETSASEKHDIPTLAGDFAAAIPHDSKVSPAEVQGFLMMHRDDPIAAVAGAAEWALEIIETKARGANVASFANEIEQEQ